MPKIYLANSVSDYVLNQPCADYINKMHAGGSRKLWYLQNNDILLVAGPIDPEFVTYVSQEAGFDPNQVSIISPSSAYPQGSLARAFLDDLSTLEKIKSKVDSSSFVFVPFVHDEVAYELASELNTEIGFYPSGASISSENRESILKLTRELNDKSTFRELCQKLDLPVARGESCQGKDLALVVSRLLENVPRVIVKRSRGSNGFQHEIVTQDSLKINGDYSVPEYLAQELFVVEEFIPSITMPSLEYSITKNCPEFLYSCDMRCPNNSWSGMVIPAIHTPTEVLKKIKKAADRFIAYLINNNFEGVFDLDCVVSKEGDFYFTETNFRTTGGTHMFHVLEKRVKKNDEVVSIADSHTYNHRKFSDVLEKAKNENVLFTPGKNEGLIFLGSNEKMDNKLRYLAIGKSEAMAESYENWVKSTLKDHFWESSDTDLFLKYGRSFTPLREDAGFWISEIIKSEFEHKKTTEVVDLCPGAGWLSSKVLERVPNAHITAYDRDPKMLERTLNSCSEFENQIQTKIFEIHDKKWRGELNHPDAIVSSLAIHHLNDHQKLQLYQDMYAALAPGGWLLIFDLIMFQTKVQRELLRKYYDQEVSLRSNEEFGSDEAFAAFKKSEWNYYKYFNDPVDKPSTLPLNLEGLKNAGFQKVDCFFNMAGHALYGGKKE